MHPDCNPELLEERKWERGDLPLSSCRECLFNVLCTDYIIYEESNWIGRREQKAESNRGSLRQTSE